jgi:hypothetical protein
MSCFIISRVDSIAYVYWCVPTPSLTPRHSNIFTHPPSLDVPYQLPTPKSDSCCGNFKLECDHQGRFWKSRRRWTQGTCSGSPGKDVFVAQNCERTVRPRQVRYLQHLHFSAATSDVHMPESEQCWRTPARSLLFAIGRREQHTKSETVC